MRTSVVLSLLLIFNLVFSQPKKLKVYISVDMEGIAGVVSGDQLGPGAFEYERFRQFMTKEALAAVAAAKESGASEILVSDSHGNGENLLIDQFPKDVRIIRSWPRRLGMMAGIDATFDAAIFIGYHSSTNNLQGVRAHTFSSARLTRVALNGNNVTEGAWNAAIAGHFGVPVIMVSGDEATIGEVRELVGNIEGAEVKKSLSFHSANTMTPEAAQELIGQKVKSALSRLKDFKPFGIKTPVSFELGFKHYRPVEVLAYLKGVERIDSHTIRFVGKDMLEVADFELFVTTYSFSLEP
ncbi:MAG: M55 family metallopeptidase [Ignavibacteriales bacterium]|nr:M55 family metallopeptidase [Ignavibacteriales bacterium]